MPTGARRRLDLLIGQRSNFQTNFQPDIMSLLMDGEPCQPLIRVGVTVSFVRIIAKSSHLIMDPLKERFYVAGCQRSFLP